MEHSPHILVIGSVNMDVVTPLRRLPTPGETLAVEDIRLVPGGKGANTAVAAARLGAAVRFIGCVGDDAFGSALRRALAREGVDCTHLGCGRRDTGTAVVLLNRDDGENAILVGAGANHEAALPPGDEPFEWADTVLLQLETPVALNVEAATRARRAGARVVLDPAPAPGDLPDELLRHVDILSPNQTELSILSGRPVVDLEGALAAARALIARGVPELAVKLGGRGALWVSADESLHVPAFSIEPTDTTAAGDAFTAALGLARAAGLAMPEAMRRACAAGALACTRLGAQPSLPTRDEVDAILSASSRFETHRPSVADVPAEP